MARPVRSRPARPVVTRRTSLTHTLKLGLLAGLALGAVVVPALLLIGNDDLITAVMAVLVLLALVGVAMGFVFWALARLFMMSYARMGRDDQLREPLPGMMWERAFLWVGLPALVVLVMISLVLVAQGESLF